MYIRQNTITISDHDLVITEQDYMIANAAD